MCWKRKLILNSIEFYIDFLYDDQSFDYFIDWKNEKFDFRYFIVHFFMFFAQFEIDVNCLNCHRTVKTFSIVNIQHYQNQLTMTWKIDSIKINNWFCFYLSICWIKFFKKWLTYSDCLWLVRVHYRFQRICCWKKQIHSQKIDINFKRNKCWNLMNFIQCRSANRDKNYRCCCAW